MITGANTNVRHRGVVFHVQTEDSGRANPQIVSHLYHGGTILASEKSDYADRLDADDLIGVVRGLKDGEFDGVLSERLGDVFEGPGEAGAETPTPMPVEPPPATVVAAAPPVRPAGRAFGEGIVSQKPLDEVILEYLAEKARDRADKTARKSRPDG